MYNRWINHWEYALATRDTNRVTRDFDWGAEWFGGAPNGDAARHLRGVVDQAVRNSDEFFSYRRPVDFQLKDGILRFTSPSSTPYPENNAVHAAYFPTGRDRRRAVVVLPQWNADREGHVGLCKLLNRFGITALRLTMAYHDYRMPPELQRADYHVSSNVGRTIHAGRQTVVDTRACLDWLEQEGYQRLGILGTSLGSCMAFITVAHDKRVGAAVYNHVSMNFGDVVWTGLSTGHVRKGLEKGVSREELRHYWSVISPATYLDRMIDRDVKSLLIWGRYDTTFLPEFSRQVLEAFRDRGIPHQSLCLPCGHYTTGQFPFKWIDGLAMCRFLGRNL